MSDQEFMNDDGGDQQRERLRGAGVLVAADATLRPTTTLMHDIDGDSVVLASVFLDVTYGDQAGRVISWLRDTANLLESVLELEN